jgi:hypothetical protein
MESERKVVESKGEGKQLENERKGLLGCWVVSWLDMFVESN